MRIVLLLLLFIQLSVASVVITEASKKITDFSVGYLYDKNGELSIGEVVSRDFEQKIPSQFTLGYRNGNAWFKITVENKSKNSDFVLYFTEPFWADFDLYEPTEDGYYNIQFSGLIHPLKDRIIEDFSPAFDIKINPGETKTYFISGHTVNGHIGAFEIYTQKEFYRPSRLTLNTFYLFYSGVLFIIIMLNFFLLVEMRESIYIYYIGYVFSFIVFISMFSGSYLSFGFAGWNEGLHTVGAVVLAFMTLFSASFLELKKYFPKMDNFFKGLTLFFVVMAILISQNLPYVTLIFNLFAFMAFTLFMILAVKIWRMGHHSTTRYYLIALIIYMPTMGMMALTFDGILNNSDFSRYTFLAGALIEIIFFSLILAARFRSTQIDKINYQKQLIDEKQKNEEYLQNEIDLQNRKIEEKNAILLHQSRHAAMGEMISMIAHQWRQPLAAISATAIAIEMKISLDEYDKDFFNEQVKKIGSFSQHLSQTIDDFRNFFRLDKEKNTLNVKGMIDTALKLSDTLFKDIEIEVITNIPSNIEIESYENELIQVMINLFKNAHDALDYNKVREPKVIINVLEDNENLIKITVEDNAGGISDEISSKIFEPYFSTKSFNGTGLGLYMSKSIVEEHCEGKLLFHNSDEGACFTIVLGKTLNQ